MSKTRSYQIIPSYLALYLLICGYTTRAYTLIAAYCTVENVNEHADISGGVEAYT